MEQTNNNSKELKWSTHGTPVGRGGARRYNDDRSYVMARQTSQKILTIITDVNILKMEPDKRADKKLRVAPNDNKQPPSSA